MMTKVWKSARYEKKRYQIRHNLHLPGKTLAGDAVCQDCRISLHEEDSEPAKDLPDLLPLFAAQVPGLVLLLGAQVPGLASRQLLDLPDGICIPPT